MLIKPKIYFLIFFSLSASSMVIDNLGDTRAQWDAISDNVMGGISEVNFYELDDGANKFYRLEGPVSTANNGGFIQVRVNMPTGAATEFKGIKLKVKGNGDEYFVHIRNSSSKLPWHYYSKSFIAKNEWQVIELPFSEFLRSSNFIRKKMKVESIKTIGLVAYGKDYDADVSILGMSFY